MSSTLFQFAAPKSKLQKFLDRYQYFLSIVATFLFFSDIPDYLFTASLTSVLPAVWVWGFVFLSLPFIKKLATIPKPLMIWMGIYITISVLSLATISSDDAAMKEFRLRMSSMVFICLMYVIYEQRSLKQVKYAILAVVFMSIATDFYELVVPKFFSELNTGRPAGFYINPNKAGCALVLGTIFTIDLIKKPYRWLYLILVFSGIAATFSRGSLLGWTLCAFFLTLAKFLSEKRRTVFISVLSLVLILALVNPIKAISDYFGGTDGASWDVLDRLEQFQNPSLEDDSAKERKAVVGFAWVLFGNHPFWGNGLASTYKWTVSEVSTHNMYLFYMADHGILGAIILPGAIFAVVWRNKGQPNVQLLCFAVFMSLWGIFSHNVLEERYILSTFALMAALNTNQKWYLKYANNTNLKALPPAASSRPILPPARNQQAIGSAHNPRILPPRRK
jgi:O-Antigen ligase